MKKFIATFLSIVLILGVGGSAIAEQPLGREAPDTLAASLDDVLSVSNALAYDTFLDQHAGDKQVETEIPFKFDATGSTGCTTKQDYNGLVGASVLTGAASTARWTAEVSEAGLYVVRVNFIAEYEKGSAIERDLLVNGEIQHAGGEAIKFNRVYINQTDEIGRKDLQGNDVRPSQVEVQQWQDRPIKDKQGYYRDPYLFYFKKGTNTIEFVSINEPMTIGGVTITQSDPMPTYEAVRAEYAKNGYALAMQDPIILEGELADLKSDPELYPKPDRTSPMTSPSSKKTQRLNMVGGTSWQKPGQFLAWDFEAPESGLYTLNIKGKQNISRDFKASRAVYIDGKIPFAELSECEFAYNSKWVLNELADKNGEAYQVYLEKGTHKFRLEVTLGALTEQIKQVQDILLELNSIYTNILIITGSKPDKMRDYRLMDLMPGEIEKMKGLAERITAVTNWFLGYGKRGQNIAALETSSRQLVKMHKDPDIIPKEMDFFKTNNGALANWLIAARERPLEVDYVALTSTQERTLPEANAGFFKQMSFNFTQFFLSFVNNYSSMGSTRADTLETPNIKVWIPSGRDQAQTLRKLADADFSVNHDINVELELVTLGALLPATVAGIGPDVFLNMGDTDPVNYAIRNAIIDLTRFDDFDEVAKRFLPERMVPLTFDGKVYALPETQMFNVLFYRKDILKNLGVSIPQTWEDVISIIPLLQKNNMNFGLPVSVPKADMIEAGTSAYFTMLFQNGGKLYQDGGKRTDLDSEIALNSFITWSNMYVNYGLPQEYDFLSRFRTGEYPVVVSNFNNFNTLMVSAPEIEGLWSIAPIPGTVKEDGTIDRSTPCSGSDSVILRNSNNYDASWEFLKWWTSADTQVDYGKEMESVMGASARHASANLEAFSRIPWDSSFYKVLEEQMAWGRGIQQVPGGYFTSRHINNAFRKTVVGKKDAKDTLFDYVYTINQELIGKRKEFGLE